MSETKNIIIKISFNYSLLDNVTQLLSKVEIVQKSFTKQIVTFFVKINEEVVEDLTYQLSQTTFNMVKYEIINPTIEEAEPGTDKPIGSKEAIDEN